MMMVVVVVMVMMMMMMKIELINQGITRSKR